MIEAIEKKNGAGMSRSIVLQRFGLALLFLAVLVTAISVWIGSARSAEAMLKDAQRELANARYENAREFAVQVLSLEPGHCRATLLAAKAAVALHDERSSLDLIRQMKISDEPACRAGLKLASETAHRIGFARDAEHFLKQLLKADPADLEAANQLAYLLGVEGRAFESLELLYSAVRFRKFTPHHLIMLAAGEPVVNDLELAKRFRLAAPDDPVPLLGQARQALSDQDFATAEPLLSEIMASRPDLQEAQARWGLFLQQRGSELDFFRWNTQLPDDVWHPEIWVVRGQWARTHHESHVAARCFWEAIRRDPNHRLACYQLGQLLQELGRVKDSSLCLKRAALLEQLAFLVDRIYENPQAAHLMFEAAQLTEKLGRIGEAWGWAHGASRVDPALSSAREMEHRLAVQFKPDLPRTAESSCLGTLIDLSDEPLPAWKVKPGDSIEPVGMVGKSRIQFEDVSTSSGLTFEYRNGFEPGQQTTRMLESIGGGIAILDFDRDGWPDLYWTQAGKWQPEPADPQLPDSLCRNQSGQKLADVTENARLEGRDFSQGGTVGDYDADGFPDVYVANIGRNRLYRNLGDGTFDDQTDAAGVSQERWTTSCLLADVNGDALPDLYDVNYLSITEAPRTLCLRGDEARTCGPGAFHAEPDQLYLNLGDGRFKDVTATSGIDVPNGKGLGIVAADFFQTGQISLFVANDSLPNFYFANQSTMPGDLPLFSEQALVAGLALSHDGLSAAWMGVATGDANGDGRIDLFSTTYANQSKSLFLQEPNGGVFRDAIVQSGLNAATWKQLGFGTQFLDAELDGWPDLVIANGHVYDLSHKNEMYQMPPQFFRNQGDGTFEELPAGQLGPFFEGRYLGRGLARLDWDRDGRDDFAVSQMNAPAALVANRTSQVGRFLTLRLTGTQTNRDAIGTRVTLRAGTRSWSQQMTAGDGFHASNERKLTFGVGTAQKIDEVVIEWLSGERSVFRDVLADSEWLMIQGQSNPWSLSRH